MNFIKKMIEDRKAKKLAELRSRVAEDLQFFRHNRNSGLLRRRLYNMLDVSSVRVQEGLMCFVDVTMGDGYEIRSRGSFSHIALVKAARKVARRLQETRLSF